MNTSTDSPAGFSSGGVTGYIRNIIIASTILITIGVTAMVSFQYVTLFRRVSLQQRENLLGKQQGIRKRFDCFRNGLHYGRKGAVRLTGGGRTLEKRVLRLRHCPDGPAGAGPQQA